MNMLLAAYLLLIVHENFHITSFLCLQWLLATGGILLLGLSVRESEFVHASIASIIIY